MKKEIVSDGETAVKKENPWKRFNPFKNIYKLNPMRLKDVDWARWKRKNLNWNGFGRFAWIILRFIIIFGICFTIIYPYLVKGIVSFMSTNDIVDSTVMYIPLSLIHISTIISRRKFRKSSPTLKPRLILFGAYITSWSKFSAKTAR